MRAEIRTLIDQFHTMDRQEADAWLARIIEEKLEMRACLDETARSSREMALQFQQMKNELEGARAELAALRAQNEKLTGIHVLEAKELFGRSTEKAADILAAPGEVQEDPIREDAPEEPAGGGEGPDRRKKGRVLPWDSSRPHRPKEKGKREKDLSRLPQSHEFDYNVEELDERYGAGNWRFAFWHVSRSVEVVRQYSYVRVVHKPVISYGLEHMMDAFPVTSSIFPKTIVSSSLLASILYDKHGLFLPLYRQEHDHDRFGFPISRQTMSNWVVRGCLELLRPTYGYLKGLLMPVPYQHCDETPCLVIHDGRGPGAMSFIWTHRSGELLGGPVIIVYCYEKTRGAEHLRQFYQGLETAVNLSSDAFSSYHTLEKEMPGLITLCGCFMHARRRFVEALTLAGVKGLSEDQIQSLPETKAIGIIGRIYHAENALNGMSAEERKKCRDTQVRPIVEEYFAFIHGLDHDAPGISSRLKDAVSYSINQEKYLRRFLEDGSIPIDNGACERAVKPVALFRRNSLFSNTIRGAEAMAVATTLIETAKANGADPYYYLKYVLERESKRLYYTIPNDSEYLPDLLPWSDAYKAYEASEKRRLVDRHAPSSEEKPRTPHKHPKTA